MEKKVLTKKKISSWSDLHPDMLGSIKSRLLAGDITTFNMICKPWRSLTLASRVFPPPIDSPLAHTPCLVSLHDNVCEFYHPVYNNTNRLECPELSGARIRSSGFGWLLLSQEDDDYEGLFFFNPFTKERINLPYHLMCDIILVITFSAPPTSPDCFVIGNAHLGATTLARVMTIRRGDASWEFHDYLENGYQKNFQKKYLAGAYCSAVVLNDKCYFLGDTCNIGVFDVKEYTWQVFGEAWQPGLTRPVSMVLEKDGGGLLVVFLSREHREVRLRRFNLSSMVWEVVERLGHDKMLYVSDGTSFLETTAATGMGNKIYFPLFDRGNIGVFYNLSTKKYHSYDGEYCSKNPFNLTEPRSSTWIIPVYAAATDVEELKWS